MCIVLLLLLHPIPQFLRSICKIVDQNLLKSRNFFQKSTSKTFRDRSGPLTTPPKILIKSPVAEKGNYRKTLL